MSASGKFRAPGTIRGLLVLGAAYYGYNMYSSEKAAPPAPPTAVNAVPETRPPIQEPLRSPVLPLPRPPIQEPLRSPVLPLPRPPTQEPLRSPVPLPRPYNAGESPCDDVPLRIPSALPTAPTPTPTNPVPAPSQRSVHHAIPKEVLLALPVNAKVGERKQSPAVSPNPTARTSHHSSEKWMKAKEGMYPDPEAQDGPEPKKAGDGSGVGSWAMWVLGRGWLWDAAGDESEAVESPRGVGNQLGEILPMLFDEDGRVSRRPFAPPLQ